MKKKITILVADDHAIVREGLRQILNSQEDMEVLGEAEDGLQAIEKAKTLNPNVLLLDIAMPNLNGLEAIALIKESLPDLKIVVLSMYANENYVQQVLNAGALGYVLKASHASDILQAIRLAYRGEFFLSPKIKKAVIGSYLKGAQKKSEVTAYEKLTNREKQVFILITEGKSIKEIADILFVSSKTVEKHRTNISSKLGIQNRMKLLKYGIKIGVVNPEIWED